MNLSSTIQTDKTLLKMQEHGLFLLADHVLIVPHICPIVSDGTRFLSPYAWIITRINLPSSCSSPFPPNPFPDSWQINTPIRPVCKILHSTDLCCPLLLGWSPGLPLGFQDTPHLSLVFLQVPFLLLANSLFYPDGDSQTVVTYHISSFCVLCLFQKCPSCPFGQQAQSSLGALLIHQLKF